MDFLGEGGGAWFTFFSFVALFFVSFFDIFSEKASILLASLHPPGDHAHKTHIKMLLNVVFDKTSFINLS
jgi:hypothetical protein